MLSKRQQEVVELAARGMPNKLIARQLGVSDGTVKAHLQTAYRKLGVTSRWDVRNAIDSGAVRLRRVA